MNQRIASSAGCRRAALTCVMAALLLAFPGPATVKPARADDWPFPDELRSRLVWVHPLINYAIGPVWQRQWEQHLVSGNGLQITSGSVSTEDLATDLVINISEPLNDHVRFVYRGVWLEGLHLDLQRRENWLGFELAVARPVSVHLQVHPTPDKEEFDLAVGLLVTDAQRRRYLKLSLRFDDFMYEEKNDLGGRSDQEPVSLQWELRHQLGRWELFSTGCYGSESQRQYPDAEISPHVAATRRQEGASTTKLRYLITEKAFIELGGQHYDFTAAEARRDSLADFDYGNEFLHLNLTGVLQLTGAWWLRPEAHWLRQWTAAAGRRDLEHRREDICPALFVELHAPGRSIWELGYMGTSHRWDQVSNGRDRSGEGYTDKVKLGWTYAFAPGTRLQLSLSHELDLSRFGGGNVQFQTVF